MILTDEATKKFEKFCKYVRLYLPITDRYVPKRHTAYLKYCGNDEIGKRALRNGEGPILKVRKTADLLPDKQMVNGFFWASLDAKDLYIEVANATKFEADPQKYEVALQYLLLHESIHWARHHAGLPAELAGGAEVGNTFEVEAYGVDVSYLWNTGARKQSNLKL